MTRHAPRLASALLFLAAPSTAIAGPKVDALLRPTIDTIARIETTLPDWRSAAGWSLSFAVLVAVLGIAASILQALAKKHAGTSDALTRAQVAGIVIGAAITGLTVIMNLVFAADHREYKRAVTTANRLISTVRGEIDALRIDHDVVAWEQIGSRTTLTDAERTELGRLNTITLDMVAEIEQLAGPLLDMETRLVAAVRLPGEAPLLALGPSDLMAQAVGESNDPWQAEQNALSAATEQMAASLAHAASVTLTDEDRNGLRDFVRRYAKSQVKRAPTRAGRSAVSVELRLSRAYASPAAVTSLLRTAPSTPTPQAVIQTARAAARPAAPVDGYLEVSASLPTAGGTVTLQDPKQPNRGRFVFTFSTVPGGKDRGAQTTLRLDGLEVHRDGSVGSTRWGFHVLNQGRIVLDLPEQRWDDGKKPTRSWWTGQAAPSGQVAVSGGRVNVTIVGLKPKTTEG